MISKKANQQSWIEKSNAIIESIADEFDCVCYVDLNKNPQEDNVEIFHTCQFLVTCVPALRGELNLEKRLNLICKNFVCAEDREFFTKSTRRETILQNFELVKANTLFQQHERRLCTWTSPDGQHRNQIDYILCSQRWRSQNKTRS